MTIDQIRHGLLLDLVDQALNGADIRLTAAARVRLRWTLADLADAEHIIVIRAPIGDNEP